jgi:hypothetical protein
MITIFPLARPAFAFGIPGTARLIGAGVAVMALADWLFYLRAPGISVAIFAAGLCAAALVTNAVCASRAQLAVALAVFSIAVLPAVEDIGLLSLVFAVAGACVFVLVATGWPARPAVQRLTDVVWMVFSGPFRLAADLGCAVHAARQRDIGKHGANWAVAWIVPIGLGGVFLLLFSQANPLIESWFTSIDLSGWKNLDLARPLFWIAVIALTWPFLQVRLGSKPTKQDLLNALDPPPIPSQTMQSAAAFDAGSGPHRRQHKGPSEERGQDQRVSPAMSIRSIAHSGGEGQAAPQIADIQRGLHCEQRVE